MKVLLCQFLFLHYFSLLYAKIDVEQVPQQNIVEVTENMSRILRFRITGEDITSTIIKYQVNKTASLNPDRVLNLNALYTSIIVGCTSGSSMQCRELQILVQGKWKIHRTSFSIQVFKIAPDNTIEEIETDEYFMVHFQQIQNNSFNPDTSPSPATEAPTYPRTSAASQTSSIPRYPQSTNVEDSMTSQLIDSTNLTLLATSGGLAMAFAVSLVLNVILGCRLRSRRNLDNASTKNTVIQT